jgi:UDP-N-acetylglucosamine diphosphorylase/glucosamine-1-phosphate N-acetyltransferase
LRLILFEDGGGPGLRPADALRHASTLRWGTGTLLSAFSAMPGLKGTELWGREELAEVSKESTGLPYNQKRKGTALFLNARARPDRSLALLVARSGPFLAYEGKEVVAAKVGAEVMEPGVVAPGSWRLHGREAERVEAPVGALFKGYWDLVKGNASAISRQASKGREGGRIPGGVDVRGPRKNVVVEAGAEVEPSVTIDARTGPVIIEAGAAVESFSRISGPCFIGRDSRVISALLGPGTSVFEACRVGGQVENSIISPFTNKAHFGYVGDSYVGEWVNLGAGSTFSNLKNTYGSVRILTGPGRFDTGMLKLGPVVGDMCKVSIGSLVYAGVSLGTGAHLSGLAARNVPSFSYSYGASGRLNELFVDSVVETQRRMMARRGKPLSRAGESLIRFRFRQTGRERRKAGVRVGAFD